MGIGAYRHLVTLDPPGGQVVDPPTWYCALQSAATQVVDGLSAFYVRGRYHPGLTLETQLHFEGRTFQVQSISDLDERHREVQLLCVEVVGRGRSLDQTPTILVGPQSSLTLGPSVLLTVEAGGTPPLSYQWLKNGVLIAGATGASYATGALTVTTTYSVRVSNVYGFVTSDPATVTVVYPPTITLQPVGSSIAPGESVTLSVGAAGTPPLVYQWTKDGVDLVGATSASYVTGPLTTTAVYAVRVANAYGTVTSTPVTVTVVNLPALIAAATCFGANGASSLPFDTTGASCIVVSVSSFAAGGVATVTDSKGNTYTPLTSVALGAREQLFYAVGTPVVGPSHTITLGGSGIYAALCAMAFSRVAAYSNQENGSTSGASPLPCGPVAPPSNGALIVTALGSDSGGVNSIPVGFVAGPSVGFAGGVTFQGATAYLIQPAAAPVNPIWTWTGAQNGAGVVAVFR